MCLLCNRRIPENETLREHMKNKHNIWKLFICVCCNWSFGTEIYLKCHEECMKSTGRPGLLKPLAMPMTAPAREASALNTDPQNGSDDVPHSSPSPVPMIAENSIIQASSLKMEPIESADRSSASTSTPRTLVSGTPREKIPCGFCGKDFFHEGSLREHRRRFHMTGHTCLLCNRQIPENETVRDHMKSQHNIKKVYNCLCCNWTFLNQVHLISHKTCLKQTGKPCCRPGHMEPLAIPRTASIRQFFTLKTETQSGDDDSAAGSQLFSARLSCKSCGKFFYSERSLSKHHRQIHMSGHVCVLCNHQMPKTVTVQEHMEKEHNIRLVFNCRCCNWSFATRRCLMSHVECLKKAGDARNVKPVAIPRMAADSILQSLKESEAQEYPDFSAASTTSSGPASTLKTPRMDFKKNLKICTDAVQILVGNGLFSNEQLAQTETWVMIFSNANKLFHSMNSFGEPSVSRDIPM